MEYPHLNSKKFWSFFAVVFLSIFVIIFTVNIFGGISASVSDFVENIKKNENVSDVNIDTCKALINPMPSANVSNLNISFKNGTIVKSEVASFSKGFMGFFGVSDISDSDVSLINATIKFDSGQKNLVEGLADFVKNNLRTFDIEKVRVINGTLLLHKDGVFIARYTNFNFSYHSSGDNFVASGNFEIEKQKFHFSYSLQNEQIDFDFDSKIVSSKVNISPEGKGSFITTIHNTGIFLTSFSRHENFLTQDVPSNSVSISSDFEYNDVSKLVKFSNSKLDITDGRVSDFVLLNDVFGEFFMKVTIDDLGMRYAQDAERIAMIKGFYLPMLDFLGQASLSLFVDVKKITNTLEHGQSSLSLNVQMFNDSTEIKSLKFKDSDVTDLDVKGTVSSSNSETPNKESMIFTFKSSAQSFADLFEKWDEKDPKFKSISGSYYVISSPEYQIFDDIDLSIDNECKISGQILKQNDGDTVILKISNADFTNSNLKINEIVTGHKLDLFSFMFLKLKNVTKNFSIDIMDSKLFDKQINLLHLPIEIGDGQINIKDFVIQDDDVDLSFSMFLTMNGDEPFINLEINIHKMHNFWPDLSKVFAKIEKVSFLNLSKFNGRFSLNGSDIVYGKYAFPSVVASGKMNLGLITIDKFEITNPGNKLNAVIGNISGNISLSGDYPVYNLTYGLNGINIFDLSKLFMSDFHYADGVGSVSGSCNGSGFMISKVIETSICNFKFESPVAKISIFNLDDISLAFLSKKMDKIAKLVDSKEIDSAIQKEGKFKMIATGSVSGGQNVKIDNFNLTGQKSSADFIIVFNKISDIDYSYSIKGRGVSSGLDVGKNLTGIMPIYSSYSVVFKDGKAQIASDYSQMQKYAGIRRIFKN